MAPPPRARPRAKGCLAPALIQSPAPACLGLGFLSPLREGCKCPGWGEAAGHLPRGCARGTPVQLPARTRRGGQGSRWRALLQPCLWDRPGVLPPQRLCHELPRDLVLNVVPHPWWHPPPRPLPLPAVSGECSPALCEHGPRQHLTCISCIRGAGLHQPSWSPPRGDTVRPVTQPCCTFCATGRADCPKRPRR